MSMFCWNKLLHENGLEKPRFFSIIYNAVFRIVFYAIGERVCGCSIISWYDYFSLHKKIEKSWVTAIIYFRSRWLNNILRVTVGNEHVAKIVTYL